jgi:precorrin-6x reductase
VPAKVLLLSGASEGPVLARALFDAGFAVSATVTTEEGKAHLFGPIAVAVQAGQDFLHGAMAGQGEA